MVSKHDLLTTNSSGQEPFSTVLQELEVEGSCTSAFMLLLIKNSACNRNSRVNVHSSRPNYPIPNTSPMGSKLQRARWVADLGQFLGKQTALNIERAEIPVIAVEDQDTMVGLAVDKIVGMEWMWKSADADNVPDSAAPFLRVSGC